MTVEKNIYETLTKLYVQDFKDLVNDKVHPISCNCWVCLWRKYKEITKNQRGKKFDVVTFLLFELIRDVKLAYLIDKGIAKKEIRDGKEGWGYPYGKLNNAPYLRKVKEILKALPGFSELTSSRLKTYADFTLEHSLYKKGRQKITFLKLLDEIDYQIYLDQQKPKAKKRGRKSKHSFRLKKDVADFIYNQPKKKANQREILRRFTTMRESDLKEIKEWLRINYEIYSRQEGRSIAYYGKMENNKGRFWTVGV